MSGSGREGNNRGKHFKRYSPPQERSQGGQGRQGNRGRRDANEVGRDLTGLSFQDNRRRDKRNPLYDRPKWTAPKLSTEPIPHPPCPYCGKPIKDMATAIADRDSGQPSHFECVAARIAGGETLESGDTVVYLGGGRFGVVHFPGIIRDALRGRKSGEDYDTKGFQIKKIFEWEKREDRAPWRRNIEEHFSVV